MHQTKRRCAGILFFVATLLTASPLLAAEAATVEFVWGTAYALSGSGERRELTKGSRIHVRDTVVTETARLQLRFTDGGFVSLVPYSEFRVNAYSYSGKSDGSERITMELIKGGLRTISGLIGKSMKSAYQMKTTVATIGIRGTEYTVVYGQSVSGTVSAGAIAVCNAGGCLDVPHGQSYYIKDENTRPVFISTPAMLSPRGPVLAGERNGNKVAEGENTDAKSSEKGEARASRDDDSLSWRGFSEKSKHGEKDDKKGRHDDDSLSWSGFSDNSKHGKKDDKRGGRDDNALSLMENDHSGQHGHKSLLTTNDDNSGKKQSDNKLSALPLADLLGQSGININDGPGLGNKGKGKGKL